MDAKKVIISFGKKSIFNRILASIFFAIAIYIFVLFLTKKSITFSEKYIISFIKIISLEIMILGFAIRYSITMAHHFNFKEMKYRTYYSIGPIGYGVWKKLKKLDRVSTFLNSREECEVNIWDIKNNRYKIAVFDDIENAVTYGRDLAKTLNIKFKERK